MRPHRILTITAAAAVLGSLATAPVGRADPGRPAPPAFSGSSFASSSASTSASTPASTPADVAACAASALGQVSCLADIKAKKGPNGIETQTTTAPTGLGPAAVQSAYQFPTSPTAGAGQTIALVDAYDDPTAEADLATFDAQYGLPPCTTANGCFTKVDENGGSNYPTPDSQWALEISLDVQWAHAIAPGAQILLVEANGPNWTDMMAAENYAAAHARYVSNSWGSPEFASETAFDTNFTTAGVSYFAASGDSGFLPLYPSASPNVVSVGGTTLNFDSSGAFVQETGWVKGGGGCSSYEVASHAQAAFGQYTQVGCGGNRGTPDVAADANPASGVAVFDSIPGYQNQTGWYSVGGTSVATPIWAARSAVAGVLVNAATVYGNSISFRDITSGSSWAGIGYDLATGRGSWIGGSIGASPTAPTLTAAAGNSIDLSWTASTSSAGIAQYLVFRNGTQIGTSTTTTYVDETDVPGTSYTYTVVAVDTAGNQSAPSNAVTVIGPPHADTTPPSAPSSLTAKALSSTQIDLYWSGAKDNVAVVGYDVYRNGVLVGSTANPYFEDSGLTPGTKYTYSIRSRDAAGNVSTTAKSTTVSVAGTSSTGSIAGFAVSSATGLPLGSVKVSATLNGKTTSQNTNSSGFYALTRLAPGTYTVTVSATGYATQTFTVTVAANLATEQDLTVSAA